MHEHTHTNTQFYIRNYSLDENLVLWSVTVKEMVLKEVYLRRQRSETS